MTFFVCPIDVNQLAIKLIIPLHKYIYNIPQIMIKWVLYCIVHMYYSCGTCKLLIKCMFGLSDTLSVSYKLCQIG